MGKIFAGLGCRRIYHSAIHEFRKNRFIGRYKHFRKTSIDIPIYRPERD